MIRIVDPGESELSLVGVLVVLMMQDAVGCTLGANWWTVLDPT